MIRTQIFVCMHRAVSWAQWIYQMVGDGGGGRGVAWRGVASTLRGTRVGPPFKMHTYVCGVLILINNIV